MENHEFRHTPRAPHIVEGFECRRYFARRGDASGMQICIIRDGNDDTATVHVTPFGVPYAAVEVMARMTADECEALARALVDAAHDLRTHNSIEALHRAIVASEGAAS